MNLLTVISDIAVFFLRDEIYNFLLFILFTPSRGCVLRTAEECKVLSFSKVFLLYTTVLTFLDIPI